MEYNLITTLKAYPALLPSVLEGYVTKQELAAADYVNSSTLNTTLANYVTEVEDPRQDVIYGRQEVNGSIQWVAVGGIEADNLPLLYGRLSDDSIDSVTINTLSRVDLVPDTTSYSVEYQSPVSAAGYFWFCYPKTITDVTQPGIGTSIPITQQSGTVPFITANNSFNMKCYRTDVLAFPADIPWRFDIEMRA